MKTALVVLKLCRLFLKCSPATKSGIIQAILKYSEHESRIINQDVKNNAEHRQILIKNKHVEPDYMPPSMIEMENWAKSLSEFNAILVKLKV